MVVAVILAGGVGSRMKSKVPKQFITVKGKPILFHTLQAFQDHPLVDAIELVLIPKWREIVMKYAEAYSITKLKWVVDGGTTGQESIRNGVFGLEGKCSSDDIVIVHDGIRPVVEPYVIDDVIAKAQAYGNGVTSMPYNEQIFLVDPERPETSVEYIPRETIRRVSTPQAYKFSLLDEKYHEAFEKGIGIGGSSYANTMMAELGVRLYFAAGSDRNIKLTTPADIAIYKGMIKYD